MDCFGIWGPPSKTHGFLFVAEFFTFAFSGAIFVQGSFKSFSQEGLQQIGFCLEDFHKTFRSVFENVTSFSHSQHVQM